MTALMRRSIDDAVRYADGLREALDQIFELREEGEVVPQAEFTRIERLVEDCGMHEALNEVER